MDAWPPRTAEQWRAHLVRHSAEFLASDYLREADADHVGEFMADTTQRAHGWLGHAPATEDAIAAAEARLGVGLPPSYRNFLLVSNGWSCLNYTLDLMPVAEIGWFTDVEAGLMDTWASMDHLTEYTPFLRRCVLISSDDGGAGGRWMLHADETAGNGEWRAYEWWPGDGEDPTESPFPDFAALVTDTTG